MKIAVDKNSIKAVNEKNEFIYLFDNEPLEELLKTNAIYQEVYNIQNKGGNK